MSTKKSKAALKPHRFTPTQLHYLAAIFELTFNIRTGAGRSNAAVAISNTEAIPEALAKTYGGEAKTFESKTGREWWGWFLTSEQRLYLFKAVKPYLKSMPAEEIEKIGRKLEKAANSDTY